MAKHYYIKISRKSPLFKTICTYCDRKIVEENFSHIKTLKKPSDSHFITPKKVRFVPKTVKEQQKINQSNQKLKQLLKK